MTRSPGEKGFGVIALIIVLALVFGILNLYSYYNPSFSLAPYSPLNYFRMQRDNQRVKDLKTLQAGVETYYGNSGYLPTPVGWCGRISGVLHPEFTQGVKPYLPNKEIPEDPLFGNTSQDYFFYNYDGVHYALMAVLEVPKTDTTGKYNYGSRNCHDWPGDNIYNYQVNNLTS